MVGGPHIHRPGPFYRYSATVLSATLWFWIFYKVKNEGDVLLGLRHPWDHAGQGHGHGHGHSDKEHGIDP